MKVIIASGAKFDGANRVRTHYRNMTRPEGQIEELEASL
jgi:hypothetical protein